MRSQVGLQDRGSRKPLSLSLPQGLPVFWVFRKALGRPAPTRCGASGNSEAPLSLIFSAS